MASQLKFARLSKKAFPPVKTSSLAAGYDLRSPIDSVIPAQGKVVIKLDLQIRVPHETYGRIAPRSGLAAKFGIDVGGGVIDEDYTGNVGVILFNHSNEDYSITAGDRIAQIICERVQYPELIEIEKNSDDTDRNPVGFGSSGIK